MWTIDGIKIFILIPIIALPSCGEYETRAIVQSSNEKNINIGFTISDKETDLCVDSITLSEIDYEEFDKSRKKSNFDSYVKNTVSLYYDKPKCLSHFVFERKGRVVEFEDTKIVISSRNCLMIVFDKVGRGQVRSKVICDFP